MGEICNRHFWVVWFVAAVQAHASQKQHEAIKWSKKLRPIVLGVLQFNTLQSEHCCYKCFSSSNWTGKDHTHPPPLSLCCWLTGGKGALIFFIISSSYCGLGLLHLQHMPHFLAGGGLFVLKQFSITLGHTPAFWCGHGCGFGATGCRQDLLPVFTTGPRKKGQVRRQTLKNFIATIVWICLII